MSSSIGYNMDISSYSSIASSQTTSDVGDTMAVFA